MNETKVAWLSPEQERDKLIELFVRWWFDDDVCESWFFNEAVRACPTLLKAVNTELQSPDNGDGK